MNLLVTAGPTREPIDPVRFISNRSSGKMGYAVAREAIARGHRAILVSGPVHVAPPEEARVVQVDTAEEMLAAAQDNIEWCDALVMAAAVADWRPVAASAVKLKKTAMGGSLELVRTPDILMALHEMKGTRVYVGFAAETHDIVSEAVRKLSEKGLDLVVANDVTRPDSGFEVDTNRGILVSHDAVMELPLMSKVELAGRILNWIETRCSPRTAVVGV